MAAETLYQVAKRYVEVIQTMEKTHEKEELARLEELRVIWHNRFMDKLRHEGIPFKDRDHVTRIAYRVAEGEL